VEMSCSIVESSIVEILKVVKKRCVCRSLVVVLVARCRSFNVAEVRAQASAALWSSESLS
jgi:hypothetical protein